MIFAVLVAATTCAAVWFLTGAAGQKRALGAVFGLIDSILWLFAGISAGKLAIGAIAVFCALCFARPFLRVHRYARIRRQHVS